MRSPARRERASILLCARDKPGAIDRARYTGGMRLRRYLLISVGSILFVLLMIILIQSGLGVDSDVTITDSNRPEIVGD